MDEAAGSERTAETIKTAETGNVIIGSGVMQESIATAGSGVTGSVDIRSFYSDLALGKPADAVLHEVQCNRIWEIDLFRTIAILLMVIFHLVFDLNNYAGLKIDYMSGFWYWEGKVSALTFIFLAGISSGFSRNTIKRGIRVLVFAMTITAATYIVNKDQYIQFGVLHILGTCMLLFPLLKKVNNKALFILAIAAALAAIPAKSIMAGTGLFIPLGIRYNGFATLDYYPLLPYFSVFTLGIIAYKLFYYKKKSLFKLGYENKYISAISRNSLAIYLIHQPAIIAVIFALKVIF